MRRFKPKPDHALFASTLLLLSISSAQAAELLAKDLQIPAKREFPVDTTVNPCDDFYAYSCNLANKSFQLPADKSSWTFSMSDSAERIRRAKLAFLSDLGKQPLAEMRSERSKTLATVFKACLNVQATKTEERALVATVKRDLATAKDRVSFANFLGDNTLNSRPSFLDWGTIPNPDNPNRYDVAIMADLMLLPEKSYFENPDVMKDLTHLVTTMFTETNFSKPRQRAEALVQLAQRIAKRWHSSTEARQLLLKKSYLKQSELIEKFPHISFKTFLTQTLPEAPLRLWAPNTLTVAEEILASEPLEVLKDLYAYQALSSSLKEAFPKFDIERRQFNAKHLGAPTVDQPLEERCTAHVMSAYPRELDADLLPRLFPKFPREKAIAMVEAIRNSLQKSIAANGWLSPEARAEALNKVQTATLFIVGPETEQAWHFNPPHVVSERFPKRNHDNLVKAEKLRDLAEARLPVDNSVWSMPPLMVNANYNPTKNKFELPLGIMQFPLFDADGPLESSLGSLGAIVGHELGHGVDDQGSNFDSKGAMRSWMTDADKKQFENLTASLIAQADAAGHNGKLVLGEVIGDLVGLTTAYNAAFPDGKGNIEAKQRLFLAWARAWCGVSKPEFEDFIKKNDPHPLGKMRVNEQMKHQAGFAEAFQCKLGDKMVLPVEKRIRIW